MNVNMFFFFFLAPEGQVQRVCSRDGDDGTGAGGHGEPDH